VIPNAYGRPLNISISIDQPIFQSLEEAEITFHRAIQLYLDLWPTLHNKRRQGNYFTPFFELSGPAFQNLHVVRAIVSPARGEKGKRFVVDIKTGMGGSALGYPLFLPVGVDPPRRRTR
jgi:hypothetical protein